ncbi:hypothetical protein GCM10009117_21320 [Gangjinia marincola]|uniref:Peptidase M1 membrane alanine aminopeptidase domain-containing protein n=1 Tax=Gangjinia marincola TaxID=578463 RepID=A0ABP3XX08_9FLAO
MKKYIFVIVTILCYQLSIAQKIDRYNGEITIDMNNRTYQANLTINFGSYNNVDTIKLWIQGGAKINSVISQRKVISYTLTEEELVYGSRKKQILIPVQDIKDKTLTITYNNHFDEIKNERFQYKKEWTEFNIYTDYFPWNFEYGLFDYTLIINSSDTIIAPNLSNDNILKSTKPTFDIPFLISTEATKTITDNEKIHIYSHQVSDSIISDVQNKSKKYYTYFEDTYGPTDIDKLVIVVSDSKRSVSYARPNFISLNFDKKFTKTHIKVLAHEIAHLWWLKAELSTWEDWLNESFAEYSALVMYRRDYGKEAMDAYNKRFGDWIKKMEAPPVWGIDKSHERSNAVVTYKGAFRLLDLEEKIGEQQMEKLLNQMHNRQIKTTEALLDLLAELTGQDTSNWFELKLKQ